MSRKVIMTTNERRLQALNQMRASYRGVQLLRLDRSIYAAKLKNIILD